MKWISNGLKKVTINNVVVEHGETIFDAIKRVKNWQSQFIVGLPKATDKYSVAELIKMDIIGLYKDD